MKRKTPFYFTRILFLFSVVIVIVFSSCNDIDAITQTSIEVDSKHGGEPFLTSTDDGQAYLSWIEYINDSLVQLQFSQLEDNMWSLPNVIASSDNWFVNWADFPSINAYKGTSPGLVTHWLEMSAEGTYDYDVMLSQSQNNGQAWSSSITPHTDGVPAEHGFVSMAAVSSDQMAVTWLDGRNTKTVDHAGEDQVTNDHHGHGGGAMTLRAAIINPEGEITEEYELDNRVCDCCQTSTIVNGHGDIIVVYRDRSEEEVRDISIVRKVDGEWTAPQNVYHDNWKIHGCPVNGPVVRAREDQVAVAWFGMRDTIPEVKVVFSDDRGANFALPYRLDHGNPLGRVDLLFLDEEIALVSWMEQVGDEAHLMAQKVGLNGPVGDALLITKSSSNRSSGFPKMLKHGDDVIFAWTDAGEKTMVRSALVAWD